MSLGFLFGSFGTFNPSAIEIQFFTYYGSQGSTIFPESATSIDVDVLVFEDLDDVVSMLIIQRVIRGVVLDVFADLRRRLLRDCVQ